MELTLEQLLKAMIIRREMVSRRRRKSYRYQGQDIRSTNPYPDESMK